MRRSEKNNSKLSRFVYYKWSGPIVFAPLIILGILGYVYMTADQEFFDPWSCETLMDYAMNIDVPKEFPEHKDITEEQHLKLHSIIQECQDNKRFSEPFKHE